MTLLTHRGLLTIPKSPHSKTLEPDCLFRQGYDTVSLSYLLHATHRVNNPLINGVKRVRL